MMENENDSCTKCRNPVEFRFVEFVFPSIFVLDDRKAYLKKSLLLVVQCKSVVRKYPKKFFIIFIL